MEIKTPKIFISETLRKRGVTEEKKQSWNH
jgi:hypothetical protein